MSSDRVELLATTAFGLEAVTARELEWLGFEPRIISTGRVWFEGPELAIARANINLRTADRVLLRIATFPAPDFDALFEGVKAIEWERWIPRDAAFPVNGRSVKSQLSSVPAVQRTVKRAIVDRLMQGHRTSELPETGPRFIVEIGMLENQATLTLDTSGEGLHKRGYRDLVGDASLKETMAAGLVLLSVWRPDRPLVDPFCGTGTIPIEAAMIGLKIAPGLTRKFDAEAWPTLDETIWETAEEEARAASLEEVKGTLAYTIHASDMSDEALSLARRHAQRAGVEKFIHFAKRDFKELSSKAEYGCTIMNPPYGKRLGEDFELERMYRSFPEVLKRMPTWSHHILTARTDLEWLVGQEATRRRKLYNAQIECTYFQFLGPKPPRGGAEDGSPQSHGEHVEEKGGIEEGLREDGVEHSSDVTASAKSGEADAWDDADAARVPEAGEGRDRREEVVSQAPRPRKEVMPAFGGLRERDVRELEDFEGRFTKRARHLRKWPSRGITCYRVYERDCPDVPVVIDRYEDHAHIFEHEREHGRTLAQHLDWLDRIAAITASVLEIDLKNVHVKSRPKQRGLGQHEKLDERGATLTAREGGLKFEVNLTDYADTGLFLDHRITRGMVREQTGGKRFLNLFCYTGSFTVYAAAGGARTTTSVDLSNTYMDWAIRNMHMNGLIEHGRDVHPRHRFVRSDVLEFLRTEQEGLDVAGEDGLYDLAVVDPPTFSNSKSTEEDWEVQQGHTDVLGLVLRLMSPGGVVYFSNNYRRFKLAEEELVRVSPGLKIQDITAKTIPEDFRNERIHRCWKLVVGG
ncbi:MAG TPA: bifunctional 23S rRNA (guanine(2069)-N(7))-methyltransferase RlmK/23S rRNA (guanine(2445)-N(2))-methyltransferase RlmL [Phycisphaerales bacterium]|nr:bifunctional 23S rRNA (guanine(2069)-N(7))-methyltransferase RlmK/23S rRNA (guanine(2445)-N(2))-methyltransferase RlmL [Phycisphaerales bacterium]